MKLASRLCLALTITALSAGAYAGQSTCVAPVVETAKSLDRPVMEEVVVTAPRPAELVAAETASDSAPAPAVDEEAAHAALRAWLREQAPSAPQLHF